MSGLTIGWEYLTGYCVATNPASRQSAEWPPHPGRVFMALAAAWFERGEDAEEGNALRWLEKLGDPELTLPPCETIGHREVVTVFVPVNDTAGPSAALLQSAPSMARSKQPRTFPAVWVGDSPCYLRWPNVAASDVDVHAPALERLCANVTRIGHSSSLVRMWLANPPFHAGPFETWAPDEALADLRVRRVSEGTLNVLDVQFNRRGREQWEEITFQIDEREKAKKAAKGRGAAERKRQLETEIDDLKSRLKSVDNRPPIRPRLGLWSGYRVLGDQGPSGAHGTDFDSDLLILTPVEGAQLPVVSTLAVAQALRGAVMTHSPDPPPSWVTGHQQAGEPLRDGNQHLAFLPLPFVGHEHADGHLLGVALGFPRWVERRERGRTLAPLLVDSSGELKEFSLRLGAMGVWTMRKTDWSESRRACKPETWTAHPNGAKTWASVTPVVLDGFPKQDRFRDRDAWSAEVIEMLAKACQRIGLPRPGAIDFDTTSWHRGSPRALVKRRPLRGQREMPNGSTTLGDGFPQYPEKKGTGMRPQVHVWLQFAEPVVGPVLLGAGRFLGYGLCKPLEGPSR